MKRTMMWAAVAVLGLMACEKEENLKQQTQSKTGLPAWAEAEPGGGLCVWYGYELHELADGGWVCDPSTSPNCAKIIPCGTQPGNKVSGDENRVALRNFIRSFDGGKLTRFFETDQWQNIFPNLIGKDALIASLQSGELTFNRFEERDGGVLFILTQAGNGQALTGGNAAALNLAGN